MDHLTKMYTVRKNCAQMLQDRGYMVAEVSNEPCREVQYVYRPVSHSRDFAKNHNSSPATSVDS